MIKIKWHNRSLKEDDAAQDAAADQQAASMDDATKAKLVQLNQQKAELLAQKRQKNTENENAIRTIDTKMNLLNKQIADLGGAVSDNESLKPAFYKNLYESLLNKKDEMYAMVSIVVKSIPLSGTPDKDRCMTYARYINGNLGKMEDGTVTKEWFDNMVYEMLTKSHISFTENEKRNFIEKLWELVKENPAFKVKISTEN